MSLGRMMTGGATAAKRRDDDFYPTPPDCTLALLRAEDRFMPRHVWEPACGDGAMARLIGGSGRKVEATDLVARGYGQGKRNFLYEFGLLAPAIVTNPPFAVAAPFIEKAHALGAGYVGILLKSTFWHAASRSGLFARHTPARIYAMTWRPDFLGGQAPTMEAIWCVW